MAKHSLVKLDIPGTTVVKSPSQKLPPLFTVQQDYKLKFSESKECKFNAMVFVDEAAKTEPGPWWYGVAAREDILPDRPEFQNQQAPINIDTVHIFFHPIAGQALDANKQPVYPPKAYSPHGPWIKLWEKYIVMIGLQIAASRRRQLLIMPIIPAETLGSFTKDWYEIITQIVRGIQNIYDPADSGNARASVRHLVVSSFSAGIFYMHTFLAEGSGVQAMTRAVIDLDGYHSMKFRHLSLGLAGSAYPTFAYDQAAVTPKGPFFQFFGKGYRTHVPGVRWEPVHGKPPHPDAVHGLIPIFMLYDALMMSSV